MLDFLGNSLISPDVVLSAFSKLNPTDREQVLQQLQTLSRPENLSIACLTLSNAVRLFHYRLERRLVIQTGKNGTGQTLISRSSYAVPVKFGTLSEVNMSPLVVWND